MMFRKMLFVVASAALLSACNQSALPVAEIKANIDEARAVCRSDATLKTHKMRALCMNSAEDRIIVPYLHGNQLLLQRQLEVKRLQLAAQVDSGAITPDLAQAQLNEFYAAGAVQRDAADAEIAQQRAARAALILGAMHSAAPNSPSISTTCINSGIVTNCQSH